MSDRTARYAAWSAQAMAVGGLLAAAVGSWSVEAPVWASRIMLLTNIVALVLSRLALRRKP